MLPHEHLFTVRCSDHSAIPHAGLVFFFFFSILIFVYLQSLTLSLSHFIWLLFVWHSFEYFYPILNIFLHINLTRKIITTYHTGNWNAKQYTRFQLQMSMFVCAYVKFASHLFFLMWHSFLFLFPRFLSSS